MTKSPLRNLQVFFLVLGLLAVSPLLAAPAPGEPEDGAVVEEVTKGRAADRAGIQPGDLLLFWSREGKRGPVRSPFDLGWLEIEQTPLGIVTLFGTREGGSKEWSLPPGGWGLKMRPTLPEALLALYEQGRNQIAAGDLEAGAGHWRSAVEASDRRKDSLRAAWLQDRLAQELARAGRWPEVDAALKDVIQRLEGSLPDPDVHILMLLSNGDWSATSPQSDFWDRVEVHLRRALSLDPEDSLSAAWLIFGLGAIAYERGDLAAAEAYYRRAHAIQEKLAPGSVNLAWSLHLLAMAAGRRGDLDTAQKDLLKALEIQEQLAPDSLELSDILRSLGMIAFARGDLSTSEELYRRSLALIERLSPDSVEFARTMVLLGIVDMQRGALAIAEEHLRRALVLWENLAPESPEAVRNLYELGNLAQKRGDFAVAEAHYRRALDVGHKLAQGSPEMSSGRLSNLNALAAVETRKGNLAKADEYLQRAVETLNKILPESYDMASTCFRRALIAVERGNLNLAEELHDRALIIREKQSPGSLAVSDSLEGLGTVAFERGDLTKARDLFQRTLAIREKMAPGSTQLGLSLNHLGQVDRRERRFTAAAEHFCRAIEAFDQQRKKLGGTTEGRSAFSGTIAEPYRDCLAALVDIGRPEEAFRTLERGRARSFLDLLAERDLRWAADLPPEVTQERKWTDAEYDRTQAALDRLSPVRDKAEVDRLLVRLRELRARQEEIAAKIRQTSPRAAALQDPQPLDLSGARAALDPGTALLAWSIGRERSFLFVVQPAETGLGLDVFPLPLTDQTLRRRVESFRNLLQRADSDRTALSQQAEDLYDALLRPAEPRIAAAERLLISPDGPLHTLPFAALVRDGRWLAEQKPLHTVLSATVYAELKKSRRQGSEAAPAALAAFGDPRYPPPQPGQTSMTDPDVRAAVGRGLSLTPLPFTGEEVRGIASLYPEARTFLGAEATEEQAKSIGKDTRYLHFACHGLLDERFPLNSALALTIPEHPGEGRDNGLLQAWEIFESVRLDSDLVTLSACDSALGQEMGGEGLLGLTRAFQYAGARSVLGSLWSINDRSTGDLMKRFYRHLRSGETKDQALRAAQIELIHTPHFSHPYYWAAFELTGDWQ